ADMLGVAGLKLPALSEAVRTDLRGVLKDFGWAANPADLTGYANGESFPHIIQSITNQPEVGTLVVASSGEEDQAVAAIGVRDRTRKNVVYLWTGTRTDTRGLTTLKAAGVPIFYSPVGLARGLKSLHGYHAWRERRLRSGYGVAPPLTVEQRAARATLASAIERQERALSEFESKSLVAAWGVPGTREEQAGSADAAVRAAERLGYPVVLKADAAHILHKTEAGVVRLGLNNAGQVRSAYAEVVDRAPGSVLIQEMIDGAVEVIVGVAYDEQLGPILLYGSGGVLVEVYQDIALRRCPITRQEALEMIAETRGARLLQGFRGRPAADADALAEVLVGVSHLAMHLEDQLAELDINPLMVLPVGEGVKAADALLVLR
ncbi:MAG: acetate--CoA ligase family protein, partial [Chloroflexota bacterium]|nr:acetate--CoA ligase family protein [Chloroflexota bacterium]